jgi:hypothetical protein
MSHQLSDPPSHGVFSSQPPPAAISTGEPNTCTAESAPEPGARPSPYAGMFDAQDAPDSIPDGVRLGPQQPQQATSMPYSVADDGNQAIGLVSHDGDPAKVAANQAEQSEDPAKVAEHLADDEGPESVILDSILGPVGFGLGQWNIADGIAKMISGKTESDEIEGADQTVDGVTGTVGSVGSMCALGGSTAGATVAPVAAVGAASYAATRAGDEAAGKVGLENGNPNAYGPDEAPSTVAADTGHRTELWWAEHGHPIIGGVLGALDTIGDSVEQAPVATAGIPVAAGEAVANPGNPANDPFIEGKIGAIP